MPSSFFCSPSMSKNRKELEKVRLADFDNGIIKSMYSKVNEPNIKPADNRNVNKFILKKGVKELR